MSGTLHDVVDRVLRSSAFSAIVDRMEAEATGLWRDARAQWPVGKEDKRQHSRDALRTALRVVPPNLVEAVVEIDPTSDAIEYAYYIRSPKVGKQGRGTVRHVYTHLLRRPGEKRAKQLATDLSELLARLARGG